MDIHRMYPEVRPGNVLFMPRDDRTFVGHKANVLGTLCVIWLNVHRLQDTQPLSQASSSGYVSSTPTSGPLQPGKEGNCNPHRRSSTHDSQRGGQHFQDATASRGQYVSANCVVFKHYQGDTGSVVDEHFSRALDRPAHTRESSPMSARNLPNSFWNSQQHGGTRGGGPSLYYSEPYQYSGDAWYQYSHHQHRAVHNYHQHNMAAQYGGLLIHGSRHHMTSHHAPCKPMEWQHPSVNSPYSPYHSMSGLDAHVQDSSKDRYWF